MIDFRGTLILSQPVFFYQLIIG